MSSRESRGRLRRCGGARVDSSSMGSIAILKTSEIVGIPTTEI